VRLPLAPAAAEPPATAAAIPGRGPARRLQHVDVLVVDDDEATRDVMGLALGLEGARVTTASSVADALAAIERQWPDVLVSDIGMPGEDGFDLIREMRRREDSGHRHVPAIALTAYAGAEDRRRTIAAGFEAHVAKPIEAAALAPLILSLLPAESRA
jgi:CheY-like chemotaxis protein